MVSFALVVYPLRTGSPYQYILLLKIQTPVVEVKKPVADLPFQDFAPLKWKEKETRFHQMAQQASARFGYVDAKLELVGDMEGYIEPIGLLGNVKFKLTADATRLLNVYYVFSGDPDPDGFRRRTVYAEWADYLSASGMVVPRRLPDLSNDLVSTFTATLTEGTRVKCQATLWTWIEGATLSDKNESDIKDVGRLSARSHEIASRWDPPPHFDQILDDRTLISRWSNADAPVHDGRVTAEDFSVVDRTASRVFETLAVSSSRSHVIRRRPSGSSSAQLHQNSDRSQPDRFRRIIAVLVRL